MNVTNNTLFETIKKIYMYILYLPILVLPCMIVTNKTLFGIIKNIKICGPDISGIRICILIIKSVTNLRGYWFETWFQMFLCEYKIVSTG